MSSIGKIRRLLSLLERLQSGRTHSAPQLAALCGVSRRTVFRDLSTLQQAGIRVLYDAARQGYWIPAQSYLPPADLTLAETLSLLLLAQEAGARDRGIPFQEVARDAALKLQSNLPERLRAEADDLLATQAIHSEPLADLSNGRQHYRRLLEGATGRKKIRLEYQSFAEQAVIRTLVSPYQMLFRRHAWYVIGRSSLHRSVRTFHLGRIISSAATEDGFEIPPRFSLKRYLGNAWNLIRERAARTDVTIRFQPLVAQNVAEVCWHATQKIAWNDDGTMDFTATVDGIQEISWWVQSYGDQALVLSPQSLRDLIAGRARNLVRRYSGKRGARD
jgi:predicted DNA-binding transcriptional regulator YafY